MSTQQQERASRLRQQIGTLWDLMDADLREMMTYRAMLKGSIYRWEHTCGRSGCHCASGDRHVHWVLSCYGRDGKLVKVYLTEEEREDLEGPAHAQRGYRKARGRLVKRHSELMKLLDRLEKALQVRAPRRKRRRG